MRAMEFIGKSVAIKIDRPMGSRHPQHGFIYPVNYGYVPDTLAPDGEELDAYLLGIFEPVPQFDGTCIAVIHRLDDNEDKLVVAHPDKKYSDEQIRALTEFHERFFQSIILRSDG